MNNSSADILNTPLENFDLSNELKAFCKAQEFENLSEMILVGTRNLERKTGFTKRMLLEYLQLLERHGLDRYMET
jgi:hypothetical protein